MPLMPDQRWLAGDRARARLRRHIGEILELFLASRDFLPNAAPGGAPPARRCVPVQDDQDNQVRERFGCWQSIAAYF